MDRVREFVRERRAERYEKESVRIREGAGDAGAVREDEYPTRWENGMSQATLQMPWPSIVEAPSLIPPGITHALDPDFQRRNVYWQAFALKSHEAVRSHAATAKAFNTFHDAAHDPDLGALNYSIRADEKIDVGAATDREIVPNQGPRQTVASLFDEENKLAYEETDGFGGVTSSVNNGRSGVKTVSEMTQRSDERLRAEMIQMRSRIKSLEASSSTLRSAADQLSAFAARQAGDAVASEIELYRAQAAAAVETVNAVTDVISGIVHGLSPGGAGDALEELGDLAAKAASHMNDEKIARAKSRLDQLRIHEMQLSKSALVRTFAAASSHVSSSLFLVEEQVIKVRSALGERKTSYGVLGESAGKAVPSAPRRDKVAASLAAIPLVETVVMKAREIRVAAVVPSFEPAAGRGLTIARENHHPSGNSFIAGCGQLRAARLHAGREETKWAARRDELFKVKESMFGRRPGPME